MVQISTKCRPVYSLGRQHMNAVPEWAITSRWDTFARNSTHILTSLGKVMSAFYAASWRRVKYQIWKLCIEWQSRWNRSPTKGPGLSPAHVLSRWGDAAICVSLLHDDPRSIGSETYTATVRGNVLWHETVIQSWPSDSIQNYKAQHAIVILDVF